MIPIHRLRTRLLDGLFIPAHPLALSEQRTLDDVAQRALTRYYLAAGADGIAVGVHTTQFEIHAPESGLYQPVLELCRDTILEHEHRTDSTIVKIGGVIGDTAQALEEAELCRELGYDAVLLSMAAFRDAPNDIILHHCQQIADIMPVFGFYLQPAVGGRVLNYEFWRKFAEIERVVAIKIAPFNRYHTLDVARAVADSGRASEIALYTGNDDHIVLDLVSSIPMSGGDQQIVGGLLGHWSYWTHASVRLFRLYRSLLASPDSIPQEILRTAWQITDCNAAVFDAAHDFAGCLPGIQEVLYRDGLIRSPYCLDPDARLSAGQREAIDRIYATYPHLRDDDFIAAHRNEW